MSDELGTKPCEYKWATTTTSPEQLESHSAPGSRQDEEGGIADRPECVPDAFHTFFGCCGLSLLKAQPLAPIHPVPAGAAAEVLVVL